MKSWSLALRSLQLEWKNGCKEVNRIQGKNEHNGGLRSASPAEGGLRCPRRAKASPERQPSG